MTAAYGGKQSRFGPTMLIRGRSIPGCSPSSRPRSRAPRWPRGWRPVPSGDFDAYQERLTGFVFPFRARDEAAVRARAERGEARHLRGGGGATGAPGGAAGSSPRGLARPILVGRPKVILSRSNLSAWISRRSAISTSSTSCRDARFRTYWSEYHRVMGRKGVSPGRGRRASSRSRGTAVAALAIRLGDADAMLCGTVGDVPRSPPLRKRPHRNP